MLQENKNALLLSLCFSHPIKLPFFARFHISYPIKLLLSTKLLNQIQLEISSSSSSIFATMEGLVTYENDDLNLKATELRLGLPGIDEADDDHEQAVSTARISKRSSPDTADDCVTESKSDEAAPVSKAQIVGWPPIRSYRKNTLQPKKTEVEAPGIYVKVSMDGAPYLRKIDLKVYKGYPELLKALENMFKFTIGEYSEREGFKGSEYAPTYEDKDGDWMLVGDVPWNMFMSSCKRLRIMKGSEARGLGCGV